MGWTLALVYLAFIFGVFIGSANAAAGERYRVVNEREEDEYLAPVIPLHRPK